MIPRDNTRNAATAPSLCTSPTSAYVLLKILAVGNAIRSYMLKRCNHITGIICALLLLKLGRRVCRKGGFQVSIHRQTLFNRAIKAPCYAPAGGATPSLHADRRLPIPLPGLDHSSTGFKFRALESDLDYLR